ncbi:DUF5817 domain-containing protein [Halanaeroarchaeum sulfurireducens]|uniref:DUF5817 domain-containing protein n=1 Tax=Halanaeroarchaeum sulfurireducens TaxID=1604004 RepID=UPI000679E606|nr:DUF5817 domain-containing protein [Halanaeroarchaeum sulfurireducens]
MYAVVGCSDCGALWVVQGRPETTSCPRCGSRHRFGALEKFVTTDDEDHARDVRATMLADERGGDEAVEQLKPYAEMESDIDEVGPSDEEYLTASGVDPAAVEQAGERTTKQRRSRSQREVVLDALDDLENPDEAGIVEYAAERGVPADYVRTALEKLLRRGEIAGGSDGYRLL